MAINDQFTEGPKAANAMVIQEAKTYAREVTAQQGVFDVLPGQRIELGIKPLSSFVSSKGRNLADDANMAVTVYAYNTDVYNATVPTSGVGSAMKETYNDGFLGKNINRLILMANGGRGLKVKEITFTGLADGGAQSSAVLAALELAFVTYAPVGGRIMPITVDLTQAIRNTQFQSGILTISFSDAWINAATQLTWKVGAGQTVTAAVQFEA